MTDLDRGPKEPLVTAFDVVVFILLALIWVTFKVSQLHGYGVHW